MGSNQSIYQEGALIEIKQDLSKLNEEQKIELELPFQTMRLDAYECRIKKFIYS